MTAYPPEAPWVTDMRRHFAQYGIYRREDLERLLGRPGDNAQVTVNGAVVYRASAIEAASAGETRSGSTEGESAGPQDDAP